MRTGIQDLRLDRLFVIYPGARRYTIADRVEAIPLTTLAELESGQLAASLRRWVDLIGGTG